MSIDDRCQICITQVIKRWFQAVSPGDANRVSVYCLDGCQVLVFCPIECLVFMMWMDSIAALAQARHLTLIGQLPGKNSLPIPVELLYSGVGCRCRQHVLGNIQR